MFPGRVPAGADVNDVAVEATDPTDVLGGYLRKAAWMGYRSTAAVRDLIRPSNRRLLSRRAAA